MQPKNIHQRGIRKKNKSSADISIYQQPQDEGPNEYDKQTERNEEYQPASTGAAFFEMTHITKFVDHNQLPGVYENRPL